MGDFDAGWQGAFAVAACYGCDGMFAGFKQRLGEVLAEIPAGLWTVT